MLYGEATSRKRNSIMQKWGCVGSWTLLITQDTCPLKPIKAIASPLISSVKNFMLTRVLRNMILVVVLSSTKTLCSLNYPIGLEMTKVSSRGPLIALVSSSVKITTFTPLTTYLELFILFNLLLFTSGLSLLKDFLFWRSSNASTLFCRMFANLVMLIKFSCIITLIVITLELLVCNVNKFLFKLKLLLVAPSL